MKTVSNNIPEVTVNHLVDMLANLYANAVSKGVSFKKIFSPFLWGPPGIGKSQAVYQLAETLEKVTSKKVNVIDVRLLLFTPPDVRGVPVPDEERRFTKWLMPYIFRMDASGDVINLFFLDELSAAQPQVQSVAYQICLDRRVGEHKLPENCIVMGAGNRMTDKSVSYKMSAALCNRLMHFSVQADFASWKKWALENGVDDRVIGYLAYDHGRMCVEQGASDPAYSTPRTWEQVSNLLKITGAEPCEIHPLISATIGTGAATEFEAWCKMYSKLPEIEDILKGQCLNYPKSYDVYYALVSCLTSAVASRKDTLTFAELENVCAYAERFPNDFAVTFFRELNMIGEIKGRLRKCEALNRWLSKHKDSL